MMFRAAALQGLLASVPEWGIKPHVAAMEACDLADAMMAECDKRDREAKDR